MPAYSNGDDGMFKSSARIYDLLESDAGAALALCEELIAVAMDEAEIESLKWAKGYALVRLGHFDDARQIWQSSFANTGSHKALHQIGMVERESGNFDRALQIYLRERELIELADSVALGANLYEFTLCSWLAGRRDKALTYFDEYRKLHSQDPIERGCFYRLEGDLNRGSQIDLARAAYQKSSEFFRAAGAFAAAREVEEKLGSLPR